LSREEEVAAEEKGGELGLGGGVVLLVLLREEGRPVDGGQGDVESRASTMPDVESSSDVERKKGEGSAYPFG
jgi:hypothetical protein